jgi:hypothetical protein
MMLTLAYEIQRARRNTVERDLEGGKRRTKSEIRF